MDRILIIGAGAAGSVVAQKCAMDRDTFKHITLASRRLVSCEKVAAMCKTPIEIAEVDADDVDATARLIEKVKPDLLINMALPYQDLPIMDACLKTGTNYMDTANYEPREVAKFEYSWQWAYKERFEQAGITAILGCGFDPGVTNIYCAYAQQEGLLDEIEYIDIVDCNAGDHGKSFATNFNPEINLREVTQDGKYWKDGEWVEIPALSISALIDYPEVGPKMSYLIYHEEEESLAQNIKGLKQIRFWMTFGDEYIKHLDVFKSIGLIGLEPIKHKGMDIVPMEFLRDLLPVIPVDDHVEAIAFVNARPRPLALYVFSENESVGREVMSRTSSGGAAINHTWMHLAVHDLPFGGYKQSGMGREWGVEGIEEFLETKAIGIRAS
jgi:saccharopine dehydrogenase (NAD+, L-lysine-forming)